MKRVISTVLIIFLMMLRVSAITSDGMERGDLIQPDFTNIYYSHTYFNISSSGVATIQSSFEGYGGSDTRTTAYLQRYENGAWRNVHYFSKDSSSMSCVLNESYYVGSGYYYRVKYYSFIYADDIMLDHTSTISKLIKY